MVKTEERLDFIFDQIRLKENEINKLQYIMDLMDQTPLEERFIDHEKKLHDYIRRSNILKFEVSMWDESLKECVVKN